MRYVIGVEMQFSCLASTYNILDENYEIIDHGRWTIMGRERYVTQAIIKE